MFEDEDNLAIPAVKLWLEDVESPPDRDPGGLILHSMAETCRNRTPGGRDPVKLWTAVGSMDLWKGGWCEVQTCSVVVETTYRHVSATEALPQLHRA